MRRPTQHTRSITTMNKRLHSIIYVHTYDLLLLDLIFKMLIIGSKLYLFASNDNSINVYNLSNSEINSERNTPERNRIPIINICRGG